MSKIQHPEKCASDVEYSTFDGGQYRIENLNESLCTPLVLLCGHKYNNFSGDGTHEWAHAPTTISCPRIVNSVKRLVCWFSVYKSHSRALPTCRPVSSISLAQFRRCHLLDSSISRTHFNQLWDWITRKQIRQIFSFFLLVRLTR